MAKFDAWKTPQFGRSSPRRGRSPVRVASGEGHCRCKRCAFLPLEECEPKEVNMLYKFLRKTKVKRDLRFFLSQSNLLMEKVILAPFSFDSFHACQGKRRKWEMERKWRRKKNTKKWFFSGCIFFLPEVFMTNVFFSPIFHVNKFSKKHPFFCAKKFSFPLGEITFWERQMERLVALFSLLSPFFISVEWASVSNEIKRQSRRKPFFPSIHPLQSMWRSFYRTVVADSSGEHYSTISNHLESSCLPLNFPFTTFVRAHVWEKGKPRMNGNPDFQCQSELSKLDCIFSFTSNQRQHPKFFEENVLFIDSFAWKKKKTDRNRSNWLEMSRAIFSSSECWTRSWATSASPRAETRSRNTSAAPSWVRFHTFIAVICYRICFIDKQQEVDLHSLRSHPEENELNLIGAASTSSSSGAATVKENHLSEAKTKVNKSNIFVYWNAFFAFYKSFFFFLPVDVERWHLRRREKPRIAKLVQGPRTSSRPRRSSASARARAGREDRRQVRRGGRARETRRIVRSEEKNLATVFHTVPWIKFPFQMLAKPNHWGMNMFFIDDITNGHTLAVMGFHLFKVNNEK